MRKSENGYTLIGLVLLVAILATVIFVGWRIYQQNKNDGASSVLLQTDLPENFAECVRQGGRVDDTGAVLNGYDTKYDPHATNLNCRYKEKTFLADNTDDKCENQQTCDEITLAAQGVCTDIYHVQPGIGEPTFMYNPVIKDNYAKLKLSDCSANHYKKEVTATIFLQKKDKWEILKVVDSNTSCADVDGTGIPIELLYYCLEPGVGFRAPK